jgi:predicted HTH transcriptional regulator
MEIVLILLVGAIFGFGISLVLRTKTNSDMQNVGHLIEKKEERLRKLSRHFEKNPRVTNNDVEKLFDVSNTTAYRYLEELEQRGRIRQIGRTGTGVYYEKR